MTALIIHRAIGWTASGMQVVAERAHVLFRPAMVPEYQTTGA